MFVFTDIVGSTRLWDLEPGAMQQALALHDRLLREVIAAHDGYVFATTGDGFGVAFARADLATRAAVAAHRALAASDWPTSTPLRIRVGVHAGSAVERDGDYFGPAVNATARIMGLAAGGQVLASEVIPRLAGPIDGVSFADAGRHGLRGTSELASLRVVIADGLVSDAGIVTSAVRGLPNPATDVVGRTDEAKRLADTVRNHRLVTMVGPGGVGKTRLAIEVAHHLIADDEEDVVFVDLVPAVDEMAVLHSVLTTLGVRTQGALGERESVVDALVDRRVLLCLDNCEHVLDPIRDLVESIVRRCPGVRLLCTSREPLAVDGEVVRSVEPLRLADAVALFLERARAIDDDFDDDPALLELLCGRLDGIPLAIELAAGRVRSMQPAELLERIDDRFRLLRVASGRQGRHQTLETAVQWSYQLLSPQEQQAFDRLSAFAGSFDLAAAEAVVADEGIERFDVAELLAALVERSMVTSSRVDGRTRFRLLETLRQYGDAQLAVRGERDATHARHAAHYRSGAMRADRDVRGAQFERGRRWFEREFDNVRAAQSFELAFSGADVMTTWASSLYSWSWLTLRHEVLGWAQASAARHPTVGATAAAIEVFFLGIDQRTDAAIALGTRAIDAVDRDLPPRELHHVLAPLGLFLLLRGRANEAVELHRRAVRDVDTTDDVVQQAFHRAHLSMALRVRQPDEALATARDAVARMASVDNPAFAAYVAYPLVDTLVDHGEVAEAAEVLDVALDHAARADADFVSSLGWQRGAIHAEALGRPVRPAFAAALDFSVSRRDWLVVSLLMNRLAGHLVRVGDRAAAAELVVQLQTQGWLSAPRVPGTGVSVDELVGERRVGTRSLRRDELVAFVGDLLDRG